MDPFHSLDNLTNHFASIAFCKNSVVYNVQNVAVVICHLDKRVSSSLMGGGRLLSTLLSFMMSIAVWTNEV